MEKEPITSAAAKQLASKIINDDSYPLFQSLEVQTDYVYSDYLEEDEEGNLYQEGHAITETIKDKDKLIEILAEKIYKLDNK